MLRGVVHSLLHGWLCLSPGRLAFRQEHFRFAHRECDTAVGNCLRSTADGLQLCSTCKCWVTLLWGVRRAQRTAVYGTPFVYKSNDTLI